MGCQVEWIWDIIMANGMKNKKYPNTSNKQTLNTMERISKWISSFLLCSALFAWPHSNWQQYYHHEVMRLFYKCVALTFYLIRQIGIWHSMFTTLCYYYSTSMNQTVCVCVCVYFPITQPQDEVDISRFSNTFASDHFILLCNFAMWKRVSIAITIIVVGWVQVLSTCKQGH